MPTNGGFYTGTIKKAPDGKKLKHGAGRTYSAYSGYGTIYESQFKNDQRHGRGVAIGKEEEYEGEFREGKRHGEGEMRYTCGDIYNGQWHDGVKSGYGMTFLSSLILVEEDTRSCLP